MCLKSNIFYLTIKCLIKYLLNTINNICIKIIHITIKSSTHCFNVNMNLLMHR